MLRPGRDEVRERIMSGTDSIWYGSPQDQVQAFRTFEINAEYRERFGCRALWEARGGVPG